MYDQLKPEGKTFKIVQLTDIHLDFDYKVGSNANCVEVLCCRANTGQSSMPENRKVSYRNDRYGIDDHQNFGNVSSIAGKYGAFGGCDLPKITMLKALEVIRDEVKPDAVLWTGDIAPHDIWNQSFDHVA